MTLKKIKMVKTTQALRNRNASKSTVLVRNNYVFVVGQCC